MPANYDIKISSKRFAHEWITWTNHKWMKQCSCLWRVLLQRTTDCVDARNTNIVTFRHGHLIMY
jgi:hypothetical protein